MGPWRVGGKGRRASARNEGRPSKSVHFVTFPCTCAERIGDLKVTVRVVSGKGKENWEVGTWQAGEGGGLKEGVLTES